MLLWDDIVAAFKGDIIHIRSGTTILPYLKGPDFKNLDPLRIAAVPSAMLDVAFRNQVDEEQMSTESLQEAVASTRQDSTNNTTNRSLTSNAARRSPVDGLVEVAMQNYTRIDNTSTARALISTRPADRRNPVGGLVPQYNDIVQPKPSNNIKSPDAPQESISTATPDITEMMMNARLGDKYAQLALGDLYKAGKGVHQNYQTALDWYQKAANQGLAYAQFSVGNFYDYSRGVHKDYSKAME
ncbi:hypothetical protein BGW39_004173 [Mortierella sp. 14UC]|nr:hypothetical protein BGW39_004173 [Mortierella sp. 14UC]